MDLDYDKDMEIDETALDVECLDQPVLALKYIRNYKHLRKLERQASEKVKTIRSECINKVNGDPSGTTGKPKPNAADIEAYYRTNEDYKKAKEEWIDAASEAEFAELVQKQISYGRKTALEGLITLHGQMYFAGPKVPRDLTKATKESRQKESNKKVRFKRKS